MTALPRKAFWPPWYILLQSIALAAFVLYCNRHFFEDDAYISLRYARNLLAGNGLSWNPGERLEGYTNFLLIMLVSGLGWLGMGLEMANRVVEFTAFFGIVAVVARYMKQPNRSTPESVVAALTIATLISSIPLLAWCLGGLEGDLVTFFMTSAVCLTLLLLQGKGSDTVAAACGLCFALAAMTRPESVLYFAFSGAVLCGRRIRVRHLFLMTLCFLILYAPYMGWRVWYFGDWLPNTYYAKAYHVDKAIIYRFGRMYVGSYLLAPPCLTLLTAIMLALAAISGRITWAMLYLAGFSLLYLAFIFSVGGDFMPYFRFMLPLIPVQALLIYHCGMAIVANGKENWLRTLSTVMILLMILQCALVEEDKPISRGALSGTAVADYVRENWPKGSTIAISPAGALPYLDNDYTYIDMLGLNDKHIAHTAVTGIHLQSQTVIGHMKGDGAYVFARRPDYIIFGDVWGNEGPWFIGDVELSQQPDFDKLYERVETYITPPAALMPQLRIARDRSEQAMKEGWGVPFARGPILDDQDRLRFIFYKKK